MRIILILLLFNCLTLQLLSGQQEFFDEGNKAYKEGDYSTAIAAYKKALNKDMASPQLYYNLGNAYFKNQNLGQAILYYEKAYKGKPSDNNIKNNLALAREEIDSPVIEIPEFFIVRYWKAFSGLFVPIIWIILQVLAGLLFLFGVYNWRLKTVEAQKIKGFGMMLLGLFMTLLSWFAGNSSYAQLHSQDQAIVTVATSLKSGADSRSETKEEISEGIKVKIIDSIDSWYKVSLMNKEQGWIGKEQVEVI